MRCASSRKEPYIIHALQAFFSALPLLLGPASAHRLAHYGVQTLNVSRLQAPKHAWAEQHASVHVVPSDPSERHLSEDRNQILENAAPAHYHVSLDGEESGRRVLRFSSSSAPSPSPFFSSAVSSSASQQQLQAGDGNAAPAGSNAPTPAAATAGPFLIPLLPFGLSNQILALKEALALAALLNWTVVPLGFWPHASELAAAAGRSLQPGGVRAARPQQGSSTSSRNSHHHRNVLSSPFLSPASQKVPASSLKPAASVAARGRAVSAITSPHAHGDGRERYPGLQQQPRRRRPEQGPEKGAVAAASASVAPAADAVIPFDMVFDRTALSPLVRVASREEAVRQYGMRSQSGKAGDASGGGGRVRGGGRSSGTDDIALLSISATSGLETSLQKATEAGLLDLYGVRTVRNHGFSCDGPGMDWLTRAVASRRWVVLYSYRRVVPAARSSYRSFARDASQCARMYHQVSMRLTKSAAIRDTARRFLTTALGASSVGGQHVGRRQEQQQLGLRLGLGGGGAAFGGGGSAAVPYYIALHVRPYPDTCFEYFVGMTRFNGAAAAKVCRNPRLLLNMVPLVRHLLTSRSAAAAAAVTPFPAALFVMSHPRVREVLRRELPRLWADTGAGAGGAAAGDGGPPAAPLPLPALFFLDERELPSELRNHVAANSLLSMVEQEVCRTAAAFIGTKASSISVLVAQERVAAEAVMEVAAAAAAGSAAVTVKGAVTQSVVGAGSGAGGGGRGGPGGDTGSGSEGSSAVRSYNNGTWYGGRATILL